MWVGLERHSAIQLATEKSNIPILVSTLQDVLIVPSLRVIMDYIYSMVPKQMNVGSHFYTTHVNIKCFVFIPSHKEIMMTNNKVCETESFPDKKFARK